MKILVVIVLCLVSALGVGQISLLNDSTISSGLSLQSGETVIIGIEGSAPSNALLNDATGATLLNDATGETLLNDNP